MVSSLVERSTVPEGAIATYDKGQQADDDNTNNNNSTCKTHTLNATARDNSAQLNRPDRVRICLQLFIFKGEPNVWNKRHVLVYFTSPDLPNFYHTIHTQREDEKSDWVVSHLHGPQDWPLDSTYLSHVNCGAIIVLRGKELALVNMTSEISEHGRDADWNCQNFVLEGLEELANPGFQTKE